MLAIIWVYTLGHANSTRLTCLFFASITFTIFTWSSRQTVEAVVLLGGFLCDEWEFLGHCCHPASYHSPAETPCWVAQRDELTWWRSLWLCSLGSPADGWNVGFGQRSNNNTEANGNQVRKSGACKITNHTFMLANSLLPLRRSPFNEASLSYS